MSYRSSSAAALLSFCCALAPIARADDPATMSWPAYGGGPGGGHYMKQSGEIIWQNPFGTLENLAPWPISKTIDSGVEMGGPTDRKRARVHRGSVRRKVPNVRGHDRR
jgi:hypothetical protein